MELIVEMKERERERVFPPEERLPLCHKVSKFEPLVLLIRVA
jgi:hypothetical protein